MRDLFAAQAGIAGLGGRQDLVRGDGTAASTSNTPLAGAAVQGASLTTIYPIDAAGSKTLRVVLKPTTLTGTVTASLQPALADGVTLDTTVAAVPITLTLNTLTAGSISLTGQRIVLLTITTAAASTVQFGNAEASGA